MAGFTSSWLTVAVRALRAARILSHLLGKEFINLMQFLAMKLSLPAPGGTRNTLSVKEEGEILLCTGNQTGHSVPTHSLQGPGSRLCVLECLVTCILINPLHRVVACEECLSPAVFSARAVFFSSPAVRWSDESRCHSAPGSRRPTAPGRYRDAPFSGRRRTPEPHPLA